ncbi:MAG: YggS family pyridoxal phosphate-dependent enzyme [Alphaproteobacteria bacterium]|nr:YggS family pyridoxal phosphate-dependent enzyme [Alphaproteobacteria bacterium]
MTQIADNKAALEKKIEVAAHEAGRDPESVRLVAVSKVQPDERIETALATGQRLFGENRVQEALERWSVRRETCPDLRLHLIGPLQTNKVKEAVALFDCIETVDRPKLAAALAQEMERQGRGLPCFIQVNTGEEEQKSGVTPAGLPDLLRACREEYGIDIRGLMCIPPQDEPPAMHFALLAKLAARHDLPDLSMGMSHDFETAVRLGATFVRVGTAFFGSRVS